VPHTACAKMLLPFSGLHTRKWGLLLKPCALGKCHERSPSLSPANRYRKMTEVMEVELRKVQT
jgi:hypothetical protein